MHGIFPQHPPGTLRSSISIYMQLTGNMIMITVTEQVRPAGPKPTDKDELG